MTWTPGMTLAAVEEDTVLRAYRFYGKNQTITAAVLGISTRTLYNKLREYGEIKDDKRGLDSDDSSTVTDITVGRHTPGQNQSPVKAGEVRSGARVEEETDGSETPRQNGNSATSGLQQKSTFKDSAKQSMSMRKR